MTDRQREFNEQDFDDKLLEDLDSLLKERSQKQADMPWMALKVENKIKARDEARRWLKDRPGGLFGKTKGLWFGWSGTLWLWKAIGAAIGGGAVGYFLSSSLISAEGQASTLTVPIALGAAFISALASLWPTLKELRF